MALNIIILAAGQGNRMNVNIPKVLHEVGGISMLERVVNTAQELQPKAVYVVYGAGAALVRKQLAHLDVKWIQQKRQLGTGHAVKQVLPYLNVRDQVLVLYGDVPLISKEALSHLLENMPHNGIGLMVTEVHDPTGFGRIIRNELGNIEAIIEHRDANAKIRMIQEINTGILTTTVAHLKKWLPKLTNKNKQGEYYLPDIVVKAVDEGVAVGGVMVDFGQVQGVNDLWQLAKIERHYQKRLAKTLSLAGVHLLDWPSLNIRGNDFSIAKKVQIDANVTLEGKVHIASGAKIGAGVYLKDVEIGKNVEVLTGSIIIGKKISKDAVIGPCVKIVDHDS